MWSTRSPNPNRYPIDDKAEWSFWCDCCRMRFRQSYYGLRYVQLIRFACGDTFYICKDCSSYGNKRCPTDKDAKPLEVDYCLHCYVLHQTIYHFSVSSARSLVMYFWLNTTVVIRCTFVYPVMMKVTTLVVHVTMEERDPAQNTNSMKHAFHFR